MTFEDFRALRRHLGVRFTEADAGDFYDLGLQDGQHHVSLRIRKDSAEAAEYEATMQAYANGPLDLRLQRRPTHDLADASTWTGDTLPDGHADKPGADFVTRDANGLATAWTYVPATVERPRGYFSRIDGTPYNAADPATYWEPRSHWRLAAPAGIILTITQVRVETNLKAALAEGSEIHFQLWTWVNPAAGFAPCAPDTAGAILVAPPEGLWRYRSINELRDLADRLDRDPVELPGEVGMGPRLGMVYEYTVTTADDTAREAKVDGRFGQFVEITITNHLPAANAAKATARFKYLTAPAL